MYNSRKVVWQPMLKQVEIDYITHKSLANEFYIESLTGCIPIKDVLVEYEMLSNICKNGCKNYNIKYCCPPNSPSFDQIAKNYKYLVVNVFKVSLEPYKKVFHTIRMTNSVIKSLQRKFIDGTFGASEVILENGSCRLCKKCTFQEGLPCRHPRRMRFSLEATGIHVQDLVKKCFDFELDWYKNDHFPAFQCVASGILTNSPEQVMVQLTGSFLGFKNQKQPLPSDKEVRAVEDLI